MNDTQTKSYKRVNVTLPQETLLLIGRVTKQGERSHFLDQAVRFYVKEIGGANLRKQLREGAQRRATRDIEMASEWFSIEDELWQESKGK